NALLLGRRQHQRHRALEERRHGRWHGPGPGHQPRRRQLTALRPEERERDALLQRLRTNDRRRTLGRRDRDLIHDHLHVHHHDPPDHNDLHHLRDQHAAAHHHHPGEPPAGLQRRSHQPRRTLAAEPPVRERVRRWRDGPGRGPGCRYHHGHHAG